MREHWTATAERTDGGEWRILGETEYGEFVVPIEPGKWLGLYRWWNPMHWRYWLRSRLTNQIAFLEDDRG